VRSSSIAVVEPQRRVSRAPLIGAALGGLGLSAMVILGILLVRDRRPTVSVDAPPPAAVTSAEPELADDAVPPAASTAVTVETAPPPPAPPPAAVPASPSPPTFGKKRQHHRGSRGVQPDCRVPYVVDDKGMKRFRAECL
jgi:hypothetical protein